MQSVRAAVTRRQLLVGLTFLLACTQAIVASVPRIAAQTTSSGCQTCCSGGSCDTAWQGTLGQCCGTISGQSYCCPPFTASGATCAPQSNSYSCTNNAFQNYSDSANTAFASWLIAVIVISILFCCCITAFATYRRHQIMARYRCHGVVASQPPPVVVMTSQGPQPMMGPQQQPYAAQYG